MSSNLSQYQVEKVGNIIAYILNFVKRDISIKRVVKLLFFIDKRSVELTGAPITHLEFKAWEQGPVPDDVYFAAINIMNNNPFNTLGFDKFIKVEQRVHLSTKYPCVSSIVAPDMSLFSKYEIKVFDEVLSKYGNWNGNKLEAETHKKEDLWDKVVTANNLKQQFKTKKTSNYPIDFYSLVVDDELKRLNYESSQNALNFDKEYC